MCVVIPILYMWGAKEKGEVNSFACDSTAGSNAVDLFPFS